MPDADEGAALVMYGAALGLAVAVIALRAYQHGRLRGAEEISEIVAAYARGKRDARKAAAAPRVEHEQHGR